MKRLFAFSLTVGLLGCVKNASVAPPALQHTAADFFALKVGTQWDYEVELLGAKKTNEVRLVKQNREGYFEDSTGAQFLVDAFGVRDQKRYLLRNPIAVGTSWTNVVSVSSVEHYEIVGVEQPCATRGGRWDDCVTVESRNRIGEGKALVNQYTLAPGVGIVSLGTLLETDGRHIPQARLELVRFSSP